MNLAVRANNTTSRSMICQVLPNRFVEIDATLGIMKGMNAKDWWKRADKLAAGSLLDMASVVFCKGGKHEILISGLACEYPDMTNALAVRMISELLKL